MNSALDLVNENMVKMFGAVQVFDCDKHGEYSGFARATDCPHCADDAEKAEEREKYIGRQKAVLAARWEKSGMPKKFCGVSLVDWQTATPAQEKARKAAQDFADGRVVRMMMLGNCGTGKTMLAAGIIGEMALHSGLNPLYTTATRLIREIRDTWRGNGSSEQQVMDKFIHADVLVVDELGAGRCSEDDKLMLSEVLCDRYALDMPTLIISNLNGEDIKARVLDERASDRLREGGIILAMKWESKRKGIAA